MKLDKVSMIDDLYKIGAIKIEEIVLKSGKKSPIYIDLRLVPGHPELVRKMTSAMYEIIKDVQFDLICGVPLTAIPFAVVMSVDNNVPMVMKRDTPKSYGTKQLIEGIYKAGQKVLVVEDVITSGSSIAETVESLKKVDLIVEDAVVFVDRGQYGADNLAKNNGIKVRSVLTLAEILERLLENGIIGKNESECIHKWLNETGSFKEIAN